MLMQDKINAFWEISKKELEDTKAQLRNKDREMEELEERHQVEIKVSSQKFITLATWKKVTKNKRHVTKKKYSKQRLSAVLAASHGRSKENKYHLVKG